MRVQRVVPPDGGAESWTVLGDDWALVEPVEAFLAHLSDQERSPNTVKAYAHDLKDYFEYLRGRGVDWRRVRFDELAGFKPWLRLSPAQRRGGVVALPSAQPYCTASTVNRKIAAVTSFYEFHARHGVQVAALIESASRPVTMSRTSFRPFLVHTRRDPPRRSGLTVPQPQHRPRVLSESEVEALFGACTRLRDRVLLGLLWEAGVRIGEALGLRHEDVRTPDGVVEIRQRVNANRARAKTWERTVPVGGPWLRLVRIEVVKQLLDHASLDMAAHYARLLDTTIRTEWEAGRGGERLPAGIEHGALADAAWNNRARTAMPNGHCGLPRQQSCDHSNKCLSCPVFITTSADLPAHEEQRRRTLKLIAEFDDRGHTRLAEQNRAVLDQLDARITEIRRGLDRARTVDPISGHAG